MTTPRGLEEQLWQLLAAQVEGHDDQPEPGEDAWEGILYATPPESPQERSRRLRRRYRRGDPGALVEALGRATARPIRSPSYTDRDDEDDVRVPWWAARAALYYVLHGLGAEVKGLPLPGRGSSGQWPRRFLRELEDLKTYHAVTVEQQERDAELAASTHDEPPPGNPWAAVAARLKLDERTVRRRCARARGALKRDPHRYVYLAPFFARFP